MTVHWEDTHNTSLTLWDIDREFQNAFEAYEQWQARHRRGRTLLMCLGFRSQDDALGKALSLGRQVQRLMDSGKERWGARFEQGDSSCHAILSAQLLRLQYEVRQPLYDSALSPTASTIPFDDIIATARSIRRTCLKALNQQTARFRSPIANPFLPPPRFKVEFCPFADQVQRDLKESKSSNLRTRKFKPNDPFDDREICPHCDACISVAAHSGLPDYRCILFTSHIASESNGAKDEEEEATFACKSCYKTFNDSYAFLDHVFQKEIGSDRSCLKPTSIAWSKSEIYMESDPSLVEQCLKNCLLRELKRVRTIKKLETQVIVRDMGTHQNTYVQTTSPSS